MDGDRKVGQILPQIVEFGNSPVVVVADQDLVFEVAGATLAPELDVVWDAALTIAARPAAEPALAGDQPPASGW